MAIIWFCLCSRYSLARTTRALEFLYNLVFLYLCGVRKEEDETCVCWIANKRYIFLYLFVLATHNHVWNVVLRTRPVIFMLVFLLGCVHPNGEWKILLHFVLRTISCLAVISWEIIPWKFTNIYVSRFSEIISNFPEHYFWRIFGWKLG